MRNPFDTLGLKDSLVSRCKCHTVLESLPYKLYREQLAPATAAHNGLMLGSPVASSVLVYKAIVPGDEMLELKAPPQTYCCLFMDSSNNNEPHVQDNLSIQSDQAREREMGHTPLLFPKLES